MLFTSAIFWIFFLIVIILLQLNFKLVKSIEIQNYLFLISNYIFYGYWDWRFLSLIILVSYQTFFFGNLIYANRDTNKNNNLYLWISIFINLLVLAYFKYMSFFANEFLKIFNFQESFTFPNIILPLGISFYTFQSLTYVLDIYLRKIEPEDSLLNYLTYISFFPQLVAGPIERASTLIPQFKTLHFISYKNLYAGFKLITIGLFMKVFIADNIGYSVNDIFNNVANFDGGTLFLGSLYFSVQLYGDFCGYSLIAIGVAKTMDFNLMKNFNTPFFSTSLQELWTRWHISLTSFLTDYLFMPLALSFRGKGQLGIELATAITFIVSGIWHGANWTFLLWGFLHGSILIIQKRIPILSKEFLGSVITIISFSLINILFRSDSISQAYLYMYKILNNFSLSIEHKSTLIYVVYFIILDLILKKYGEYKYYWFKKRYLENIVLSIMLFLVITSIHPENTEFIYFKF